MKALGAALWGAPSLLGGLCISADYTSMALLALCGQESPSPSPRHRNPALPSTGKPIQCALAFPRPPPSASSKASSHTLTCPHQGSLHTRAPQAPGARGSLVCSELEQQEKEPWKFLDLPGSCRVLVFSITGCIRKRREPLNKFKIVPKFSFLLIYPQELFCQLPFS